MDCKTPGDDKVVHSPRLTAVILTLNEADNIVACIDSLRWSDQIVVFDSYSLDNTVALSRDAGVTVIQNKFENYAQQRNDALDRLETDWILFVDADERSTAALAEEIRRVIRERPEKGWYLPRHNYIFGKLTTGAGWYPDYQLRLFEHSRVRYERPVHEVAVVDGQIGRLKNPLIHYNYLDLDQFKAKQRAYTSYDAKMLLEDGMVPLPHKFIREPLRQFWWRFVTLNGYRDGWHGFRLSVYMAYYEWVKYRKLAWMWRKR